MPWVVFEAGMRSLMAILQHRRGRGNRRAAESEEFAISFCCITALLINWKTERSNDMES
jgi:hypothetical protein